MPGDNYASVGLSAPVRDALRTTAATAAGSLGRSVSNSRAVAAALMVADAHPAEFLAALGIVFERAKAERAEARKAKQEGPGQ